MPKHIPYIRVFLSSPGDVAEERKIALDIIESMPYRSTFREKVAFRVVAWDKPGAGTAMVASLTPQEAINRGLLQPSECDIFISIFGARMGTPFTDVNGKTYLSGSHWELMNALESDRTETLIFRRTRIETSRLENQSYYEQYQRVEGFFGSDVFVDQDTGAILRGFNTYKDADEFRTQFEILFEQLMVEKLDQLASTDTASLVDSTTSITSPEVLTVSTDLWSGSPFPGLRAFTQQDEQIFFGRERETDQLVDKLRSSRFIAVLGSSGSGKSSLVKAGLIPRLRANAITDESTGSRDWFYCISTPNDDPFLSLAESLSLNIPDLLIDDPIEYHKKINHFSNSLAQDPEMLSQILEHSLENAVDWAEVLIFIDQFEELFTLAKPESLVPFVNMILLARRKPFIRVIITMRSDYLSQAIEYSYLAELLNSGTFLLSTPKRDKLRLMIERPAERAGLLIEDGLTERLLDDIGDNPGNVSLMGYVLDELYSLSEDTNLTFRHYEQLGGMASSVGNRAERTYNQLSGTDEEKRQQFHRIFRELVTVDEKGTAARIRASIDRIIEADIPFVEAFVRARLFIRDNKTVELAHEILIRGWDRLKAWVDETSVDLQSLRQLQTAVYEWISNERPEYLLWPHERLSLTYDMLERLEIKPSQDIEEFIRPEANRIIEKIRDHTLPLPEKVSNLERLKQVSTDQLTLNLGLLHSDDHIQRLEAIDFLRRGYIVEALDSLIELLEDNSVIVRESVLQTLCSCLDDSVLDKFIKLLSHDDPLVRARIAQSLGEIGNKLAVDGLVQSLSDSDVLVRRAAAYALGKIGDIQSLSPLLNSLDDEAWQVRRASLHALSCLRRPETFEFIEPLLKDQNLQVKISAVYALGRLPNSEVYKTFSKILSENDFTLIKSVVDVLKHRHTDSARDLLAQYDYI